MMKYEVLRTDTADAGIRKIILYVAQNFGNAVALEKLDEIEKRILDLGDDPYITLNVSDNALQEIVDVRLSKIRLFFKQYLYKGDEN